MSPLYRIVEDALHPSGEVVGSSSDYLGRQIRGFRSFVVYGYREVDGAIAWSVIEEEVPPSGRMPGTLPQRA